MFLIITFIPNQYQSSKSKQASKQCTASPSPSLRLKGLAQARRACSGEPPLPRRGLEKKHQETNAGSRLGETPLAWARCSLAQKLSESPGRPFAQKGLGESLFVSPR
ncbi:hypothetical protein DEO72_LG4g1505 [Vigna unguiculata]|uniref:Uncharacterized protein n=1 Tax=Vigna unguiculata TaxID=3917 RepID=A0A4D6LNT0_VIGUN|nr:hypothetical protein DEO72_LG4g1505 [Vigna unguiculata]